jgi:hypothetical protein
MPRGLLLLCRRGRGAGGGCKGDSVVRGGSDGPRGAHAPVHQRAGRLQAHGTVCYRGSARPQRSQGAPCVSFSNVLVPTKAGLVALLWSLVQSAASQALQEAGCFAVVLECIPPIVGAALTRELSIPTIGIGAGPFCSGQASRFSTGLCDEARCCWRHAYACSFAPSDLEHVLSRGRCWCTTTCWA